MPAAGLMESAAEYLPEARWQRCMVHFYRNVFSHVPATKVREVSHMLKAIHAQESRDAADRKARAIDRVATYFGTLSIAAEFTRLWGHMPLGEFAASYEAQKSAVPYSP